MSNQLNCIVLVDDNEAHNFYHKFELNEAQVASEVVSFSNTDDAQDFILNKHRAGKAPDLLLLDYNMPKIQGIDFILKLKRESQQLLNKMKVIMLSASQLENTKALLEVGASGFVVKPIDQEAISGILKEHF